MYPVISSTIDLIAGDSCSLYVLVLDTRSDTHYTTHLWPPLWHPHPHKTCWLTFTMLFLLRRFSSFKIRLDIKSVHRFNATTSNPIYANSFVPIWCGLKREACLLSAPRLQSRRWRWWRRYRKSGQLSPVTLLHPHTAAWTTSVLSVYYLICEDNTFVTINWTVKTD